MLKAIGGGGTNDGIWKNYFLPNLTISEQKRNRFSSPFIEFKTYDVADMAVMITGENLTKTQAKYEKEFTEVYWSADDDCI